MRDKRFIAVYRGGPLDLHRHRLLAAWAADCAEHVQFLVPQDERPAQAIAAARAWARGEITVGAARAAAVAAHAAARSGPDGGPRDAARAAGHAAATAHMADHALGGAVYALKAVRAVSGAEAMAAEQAWQQEHLPEDIRELVLSAIGTKMILIQ